MQNRPVRLFSLPTALVVLVLLASAWNPRRESVVAASGTTTTVFRPLAKVSDAVLANVATVMHKRLVALGNGSSTAKVVNGVIVVRLADVRNTAAVLAVLDTPARLYSSQLPSTRAQNALTALLDKIYAQDSRPRRPR